MRKPCAPGLAGAAALCGLVILVGCGGNSVAPSISVTPPSATVTPGGKQQFFAHVDNATNPVADFSVQPGGAGGTINASGLYTAPSGATAGQTDIIRFTARDNSAPPVNVTVTIDLGVEVSPPSADVSIRRTFQFTAIVSGDPLNRVTWSVDLPVPGGPPTAGGTIDANGLYTAPATAVAGVRDTVRARSISTPVKEDTATVSVRSSDVPVNVQ